MEQIERYNQAKVVTLIGALVNALLGLSKLVGGYFYHSHALIADGVHSFSDLITDSMVLFASKYGSQNADSSHPYGHRRIETAAIFLLALLLILAGSGIAWDGLYKLAQTNHGKPGWLALPIAIVSILANEGLYHYTRYVGQRIQSTLLIANAWHHRSDAASSIIVAMGLIGSYFGFTSLDAIAAILIGLMIIKMGIHYGWNSVKELVDTAVEPAVLTQITLIIQSVTGVEKIHQLRSRLMGGDVYIDVHILVSPYISVSEGHYIAQRVHDTLLMKLPKIKDVTVHVDPEDDQLICPSCHLPSRSEIENSLLLGWQSACPSLQNWVLHYLEGKIYLDLFCSSNDHKQALVQRIKQDLSTVPAIYQVRLFTCQETMGQEKNTL